MIRGLFLLWLVMLGACRASGVGLAPWSQKRDLRPSPPILAAHSKELPADDLLLPPAVDDSGHTTAVSRAASPIAVDSEIGSVPRSVWERPAVQRADWQVEDPSGPVVIDAVQELPVADQAILDLPPAPFKLPSSELPLIALPSSASPSNIRPSNIRPSNVWPSSEIRPAGGELFPPAANAAEAVAAIRQGDTNAAGGETVGYVVPIIIQGVRVGRGPVRVALFTAQDGFPDPQRAIAFQSLKDEGGRLAIDFTLPRAVPVAVAAYQDLDNNGTLTRGRAGIPVEPFAFSNNASSRRGPPLFSEAAVQPPVAAGSRMAPIVLNLP